MGLALLAGMGFGLVMGWTPGVALTVGLFAYNSVAVGPMLQRGIEDRVRSLRVSTLRAFRDIAVTNRRRFGSHIIHLGVALLALAIAFSQAYRVEAQKTLRIGESWRVMGLELRLQRVGAMEERNRFAVVATVQSPTLGLLRPRLNFYPTMQAPLAAPSVKYTLLNDYYLVLQEYDRQKGEWATLRLILTPMVLWLWFGGTLIMCGILHVLWPLSQEVRAGTRQLPS